MLFEANDLFSSTQNIETERAQALIAAARTLATALPMGIVAPHRPSTSPIPPASQRAVVRKTGTRPVRGKAKPAGPLRGALPPPSKTRASRPTHLPSGQDTEGDEAMSATATIINNLELYGARPGALDDNRDYPCQERTSQEIAVAMEAMTNLCEGTKLEEDQSDLLWGIANIFHGKCTRTSRKIGDLHGEIRQLLREQDGSEVASTALEDKQAEAEALEEKLESLEDLRAAATSIYSELTGQAWRAPSGSVSNRRRGATASVISAREYLAAAKAKEAQRKCPEGPRIAFAGDPHGGNILAVEKALDALRAKYPNMVLVHSNYKKGDDLIARNWADRHEVPQVIVGMNFDKHGNKRAGFVRNEEMIALGLQGVVLMPGNGVTKNLGQKAEEAGINVLRVNTN